MYNQAKVKNLYVTSLIFIALLLTAGGIYLTQSKEPSPIANQAKVIITEEVPGGLQRVTLAPGCFWCMEATLQETDGISAVISGYAGGTEYNPTYEDVYKEITGHRETVMAYYDPAAISYREVLDIYLRNIDPTDPGGQFFDRGDSYTTAIFYETDEEKATAEAAVDSIRANFDKPVVVKVLPFTTFYQAEDYHQDFYLKSPGRYQNYAGASGRKEFKERVWAEIQKEEG